MIAWYTKCRAVHRNLVDAVLSGCALLIVPSLAIPLILHCLFGTLYSVLTSVKLGVTTVYILMGFIIELLSTI